MARFLAMLAMLAIPSSCAAAGKAGCSAGAGAAAAVRSGASPPPPLAVQDGALMAAGSPLRLQAANWLGGPPTGTTAGLWAGSSANASRLAALTHRLLQLRLPGGINSVRLPFSFDDLASPSTKAAAGLQPCSQAGTCATGLEHLLWTLDWFAANGFYVLLSYQPPAAAAANASAAQQQAVGAPQRWPAQQQQQGAPLPAHASAQAFAASWAWLWRAITCLDGYASRLRGRLLLDLLAHPDALGLRWEANGGSGTQGTPPGLSTLYLAAMDELDGATPGAPLFFLHGGGQAGRLPSSTADEWAGGFATEPGLLSRHHLSDPNPFLQSLLTRRYRNQIVIAPQLFAPLPAAADVPAAATAGTDGSVSSKLLDASFVSLSSQPGYCLDASATCQRFPVALAEPGWQQAAVRSDLQQQLLDFAAFVDSEEEAEQQPHLASSNGSSSSGTRLPGGSWYYFAWQQPNATSRSPLHSAGTSGMSAAGSSSSSMHSPAPSGAARSVPPAMPAAAAGAGDDADESEDVQAMTRTVYDSKLGIGVASAAAGSSTPAGAVGSGTR